MRACAGWSAALLVPGLLCSARAEKVPLGFQAERRVGSATRLDWEFAAGPGARLPAKYDSRRQRYQLFVPETYRPTSAWPLVVVVTGGDAPLAWKAWQKPCEKNGWLYCSAYGAGNDCPPGQRIRALCDMLDDVRRHYRIDADRTYLAGVGGGAWPALQLAGALPELFGGVVLIHGDGPLPGSDHLRERLRERLSVALVCGDDDRIGPRLEKFRLPLLTGLDVRARLWRTADREHTLPPAEVLLQVQRWLEDDLDRRRADSRDQGTTEEVPSRLVLAGRGLARAKEELRKPARAYRAAAMLEWLAGRFGATPAGREARKLHEELRDDPIRGQRLVEQAAAASRRVQWARAAALEKAGRLAEARRTWEKSVRPTDPPAVRRQAAAEVRRLTGLLARAPYLGLTLEGDTTVVRAAAPGGPAQRAGVRDGDRLVQLGETRVAGPAAVRRQLERHKPGDVVELVVVRGEQTLSFRVRLAALPAEE